MGRAVFFLSLLEPHSNHIFVKTRINIKNSNHLLKFSKKKTQKLNRKFVLANNPFSINAKLSEVLTEQFNRADQSWKLVEVSLKYFAMRPNQSCWSKAVKIQYAYHRNTLISRPNSSCLVLLSNHKIKQAKHLKSLFTLQNSTPTGLICTVK